MYRNSYGCMGVVGPVPDMSPGLLLQPERETCLNIYRSDPYGYCIDIAQWDCYNILKIHVPKWEIQEMEI